MARFSEEEVETLRVLVEMELEELKSVSVGVFYYDYAPHLHSLLEKLEKYQEKHFKEEDDGTIFE